jgi:hypothetical protein
MIRRKPAPDLIRGGNRFGDKIMRRLKPPIFLLAREARACIATRA